MEAGLHREARRAAEAVAGRKAQHRWISKYGCISMQRYWSSLRYSFLRTLFLLAADLRRHPSSIYRHLGNTPPRSTV